jgi:hypothetical protein
VFFSELPYAWSSSGCRLLDIAAPVILADSEAGEAGLASATLVRWPLRVFALQHDATDKNVKGFLEKRNIFNTGDCSLRQSQFWKYVWHVATLKCGIFTAQMNA